MKHLKLFENFDENDPFGEESEYDESDIHRNDIVELIDQKNAILNHGAAYSSSNDKYIDSFQKIGDRIKVIGIHYVDDVPHLVINFKEQDDVFNALLYRKENFKKITQEDIDIEIQIENGIVEEYHENFSDVSSKRNGFKYHNFMRKMMKKFNLDYMSVSKILHKNKLY